MNKSQILRNFIVNHLDDLEHTGGGGTNLKLPNFELHSYDYLEFAEKRLNNIEQYHHNADELINCVAHLKRAVDCQLDTFLHCCNLYKTVASRNLKFDKKLLFLKEIGVYSSRSLSRLNTLRNQMEHQCEVPKVADLELYFDLVSAFISVIQGLIFTIANNTELEFCISDCEDHDGIFNINYNIEIAEIAVHWWIKDNNIENTVSVQVNELDDFTYFFKTHLLLVQFATLPEQKNIIAKLKS